MLQGMWKLEIIIVLTKKGVFLGEIFLLKKIGFIALTKVKKHL